MCFINFIYKFFKKIYVLVDLERVPVIKMGPLSNFAFQEWKTARYKYIKSRNDWNWWWGFFFYKWAKVLLVYHWQKKTQVSNRIMICISFNLHHRCHPRSDCYSYHWRVVSENKHRWTNISGLDLFSPV